MSPSLAVCTSCGHVFSEQEALDPCPRCGGAERTLRREELVVDRSGDQQPETRIQVEERRPDGTSKIVQDEVDTDIG